MALIEQAKGNSVLIFTRTKHQAMRLAEQIKKTGLRATSLQGNLSQAKRQYALDGFRRGHFQILVATDIAARGIDVNDIAYVINFDIPDTPEAYTHRIGRTGRAEKTGEAFTLITNADLYLLRIIERTLGKRIERRTIEGLSLDMSHVMPARQDRPRFNDGTAAAHNVGLDLATDKTAAVHRSGYNRGPTQREWFIAIFPIKSRLYKFKTCSSIKL